MIDQYRTNDVGIIARQWQALMKEKSQASLIYQLVAFDTATVYDIVGQVPDKWHILSTHTREWWSIGEESAGPARGGA